MLGALNRVQSHRGMAISSRNSRRSLVRLAAAAEHDEAEMVDAPSLPPSLAHLFEGRPENWGFKVDGMWWDRQGARNGPPMNYWKQRTQMKMEFLNSDLLEAARAANAATADPTAAVAVRTAANEVAFRRSIVAPTSHKFLPGAWRLVYSEAPTCAGLRMHISAGDAADGDKMLRYTVEIVEEDAPTMVTTHFTATSKLGLEVAQAPSCALPATLDVTYLSEWVVAFSGPSVDNAEVEAPLLVFEREGAKPPMPRSLLPDV